MIHAGTYSSVLNWLKAVDAIKDDGGKASVDQMKTMTVNDFFAKDGVIREDGRMVHDMYLAEVKSPDASSGEWDYYNILRTIPGDQAYQPMSESRCPAVSG